MRKKISKYVWQKLSYLTAHSLNIEQEAVCSKYFSSVSEIIFPDHQITTKYLLPRLFQFTANPYQILKYQFGVLLESIVNS